MVVNKDGNGHIEVINGNSIVNGDDNSNADKESNGESNDKGNGCGGGEGIGDWGNATLPFPVKMASGLLTKWSTHPESHLST